MSPTLREHGQEPELQQRNQKPVISEEQAVWLSFRAQSKTDTQATRKLNTYLGLDPPLSESDILAWWQEEQFSQLACNVIGMPASRSFGELAETLFPEAYRALKALLNSKDDRGKAKGVELLLRLHGLLIDRVKTDAPDTLNAVTEMLREVKQVAVIESYARSPGHGLYLEGDFQAVANDHTATQDN